MGVSIEKMIGVNFEVRVGDSHSGDPTPYTFGFVAKEIDSKTIEFRLLSTPISKKEMRQVREAFEALGYPNLKWFRKKDGLILKRGTDDTVDN